MELGSKSIKTRPAINMWWRTDKISATYLLHFSALYSATKDVTNGKENIFLLGLFSAVSVSNLDRIVSVSVCVSSFDEDWWFFVYCGPFRSIVWFDTRWNLELHQVRYVANPERNDPPNNKECWWIYVHSCCPAHFIDCIEKASLTHHNTISLVSFLSIPTV